MEMVLNMLLSITDEEKVMSALSQLKKGNGVYLFVADDDRITGAVPSFTDGNKNYPCAITVDGFTCGCVDFSVNKNFCKHLCFLALYASQSDEELVVELLKNERKEE